MSLGLIVLHNFFLSTSIKKALILPLAISNHWFKWIQKNTITLS
jgi:hypothetical protein